MHPALLAGLAGVIAVGGAVTVAHQTGFLDDLLPHDMPDVHCFDGPLEPYDRDANARIDFRITSTEAPGRIHLCLLDLDGVKRWEYKTDIDGRTTVDYLAEVPVGAYFGVMEAFAPKGGQGQASSYTNPRFCNNYEAVVTAKVTFHADAAGIGLGSTDGDGCGGLADRFANRAGFGDGPGFFEPSGPQPPLAGTMVASGLSLGALGGLAVWQRHEIKFLAARLFTRLQKPALLDQATRGRIHDLVVQEPGIHGSAIAQRLELASGQTVHHLRVLVRERLLIRVGTLGAQHYFRFGKFSPTQMRLLSALRHRSAKRLYQAVAAQPGQSLSDASRRSGLSLGRASRIARRLADAGLVLREPQGRNVVLRPAPIPAIT